jgi:glycosyltransferase 2 family protein
LVESEPPPSEPAIGLALYRLAKVQVENAESGPARLREAQSNGGNVDAERASAKTARSLWWALVRLAIGVVLLVYLAKARVVDFQALGRLVTAWPVTLAGLGLILTDVALMAVRLCLLFGPQGFRLPLGKSLELSLVSLFFTTFLPGSIGGDVAKLFYAAKHNRGRRTEIATIVAFDRVVGLFSVLLLPLLFAPLFPELIRSVKVLRVLLMTSGALAAGLLVAFLLCLFEQSWINRLARWTSKFPPGRKVPERVVSVIGQCRGRPGVLFAALAVSLAANLTLVGAIFLAISLLNPGSLSLKICLVAPMGDVVNSLPLTPGGLGVGETAFNALFKLVGLQSGAEALLCWRIWRVMAGLAGLALYLRGVRRAVFDADRGIA